LKGLISKNREQKTRAFTVREFDHLIKKNQNIKGKILKAVETVSKPSYLEGLSQAPSSIEKFERDPSRVSLDTSSPRGALVQYDSPS